MKVTLADKKPEVPGVMSFILQPEEQVEWQAGQYGEYVLPHDNPDQEGDSRYFTISAAPFENHLMITTRETHTSFKKALDALPISGSFELKGVDGDFVVNDPQRQHVFIAGGIGITPFRAILADLDHRRQPINVRLLYGNRDSAIVFRQELDEIAARNSGLIINYLVDPERIDTDHIKRAAAGLDNPIYYVSGPAPMVFAIEKLLKEMNIGEENIKLDDFPGYEWPEK